MAAFNMLDVLQDQLFHFRLASSGKRVYSSTVLCVDKFQIIPVLILIPMCNFTACCLGVPGRILDVVWMQLFSFGVMVCFFVMKMKI